MFFHLLFNLQFILNVIFVSSRLENETYSVFELFVQPTLPRSLLSSTILLIAQLIIHDTATSAFTVDQWQNSSIALYTHECKFDQRCILYSKNRQGNTKCMLPHESKSCADLACCQGNLVHALLFN